MRIHKIIEREVDDFLTGTVQVSEGYNFSQWRIVKRILTYLNCYYADGKVDSQNNYKYWFDIISPRVDSEVKNIDFDTKDILLYSDPPTQKDFVPLFIANAALRKWLRDTGQGVKLNDAIEDGSAWGNVLWEKVKGGYEQCDLVNTIIVNQVARTVDETPIIRRHELTQSDLRAKTGIWKNLEEVIKECGKKSYSKDKEIEGAESKQTENPFYEIFQRDGEVSLADLKEAQGLQPSEGDAGKYVLARIVVAGLTPGKSEKEESKYVLYADTLSGKMSYYYKEYHRGRYTGRWFRKGLVETLFDIQTRVLYLGNQIAQGVEMALKIILRSDEKLSKDNVLTDLLNGHIIKAKEINQIVMQIPGLQAAIDEWNRLMVLADKLSNSYEVVQGENTPSNQPFRTTALINANANKFFEFAREKLGLPLESVIGDWVVPELLKDLKSKEVLELTGDDEFMDKYYQAIAKAWYFKNLFIIGPHTKEEADTLIQEKVKELRSRPMSLLRYEKEMFDGFKPKVKVAITGESLDLREKLDTLASFIALEQDLGRRNYLLDKAYQLKGIDVPPPTPPQQLLPTNQSLMASK